MTLLTQYREEAEPIETEKQMVDRLKATIVLLEKENEIYEITNRLIALQRRSFEIVQPENLQDTTSDNPLESQILEEAYRKQEPSLETPEIEEIRIEVLELLERRYSIYTEFGNGKEAHTDLCNSIELLEEDIVKLQTLNADQDRIEKRKLWVARLLVDRAQLYFTFLHSLYQGPEIEQQLDKNMSQKQKAEIVLGDINSKLTQLAEMLGMEEDIKKDTDVGQKTLSIMKATKYQVEADNRMKRDLKNALQYDPQIAEHHSSYTTIEDFMKELGDKRKRAGNILRFIIIIFFGYFIAVSVEKSMRRKKEEKEISVEIPAKNTSSKE